MPTLEQMIERHSTEPAKPETDDDSIWRHELRLPREGETVGDVWRKAQEFRARTGVSLAEIMKRDRR
jgi:hypothetical protein